VEDPTPSRLRDICSPEEICNRFGGAGLELKLREWQEILLTAKGHFDGLPGHHGTPLGRATIRGGRDDQKEPLASEILAALRALNVGAFALENATIRKYRKWAAVPTVRVRGLVAAVVAQTAARAGKKAQKKKKAGGVKQRRSKRSRDNKTQPGGKFGTKRTGVSAVSRLRPRK
jgi:hypothetical protein